ncbi:hypothetical protein B0H11DRAFT_2255619 [Mycena galericulata]|nr:hypothetical protein B0H11DRAFT_2255619 [Mycena galericulata]
MARLNSSKKAVFRRERRAKVREQALALGITPIEVLQDEKAWIARALAEAPTPTETETSDVVVDWGDWGSGIPWGDGTGDWGSGTGGGSAVVDTGGWGTGHGWPTSPGCNI